MHSILFSPGQMVHLGHCPMTQKAAVLIPGQDANLDYGFESLLQTHMGEMLLFHNDVSPSPSLLSLTIKTYFAVGTQNMNSCRNAGEYKRCFFSLVNEHSVRLLTILLRSNPSLCGFCTAGVGAAGRVGGSASEPAQPSPGSTQNTGEARTASQPTWERRATPEERRAQGKCKAQSRSQGRRRIVFETVSQFIKIGGDETNKNGPLQT